MKTAMSDTSLDAYRSHIRQWGEEWKQYALAQEEQQAAA
jgi:hypothetical protein